jgi:hypothetical protein
MSYKVAVQTDSAHHRNFYLHNLISVSYLHYIVSRTKMTAFVIKEFVLNFQNSESSQVYQPLPEFKKKKN